MVYVIDEDNGSQNVNDISTPERPHRQSDELVSMEENCFNTSFSSAISESHSKCFSTQNIPLSPFNTQPKHLSIMSECETPSQLIQSELLNLCSGVFNSIPIKSDENFADDEEDEDLLSRRSGKIFNIDSDVEDDDQEDDEKGVKRDIKEDEDEVLDDIDIENENSEVDDIDEEVEDEENISRIRKGFIEDEAELSGSEVSSDEDEGEDDYEEEDGDKEDLPSDSELRNQIEKFHNKALLDEDKRQILLMKEKYFEDGDLHEDGGVRQKKFRWHFDDNSEFKNNYLNEDSDDENCSEDEKDFKTPTLKMFAKEENIKSETQNTKSISIKPKFESKLDVCGVTKFFGPKKNNSISSFVIRDERLKNVISKRTLSSKDNSLMPRKKAKNSKNGKTSIFDLLNV